MDPVGQRVCIFKLETSPRVDEHRSLAGLGLCPEFLKHTEWGDKAAVPTVAFLRLSVDKKASAGAEPHH